MRGRWLRMAAELKAAATGQNGQKPPEGTESGPRPTVQNVQKPAEEAEADRFEERAAIVEFKAGIPRAWAEGFAAMQCAQVPGWASLRPGMWGELVNAVGIFLDRWGPHAAALGWTPIDLFGALPAAPLARMDQQGLVFFLADSGEVTAMTADTASDRRASGVIQTYRRRARAARHPRTAPVWEIADKPYCGDDE